MRLNQNMLFNLTESSDSGKMPTIKVIKFLKELDGTHRKGASNTIRSILPVHKKGGGLALLRET